MGIATAQEKGKKLSSSFVLLVGMHFEGGRVLGHLIYGRMPL